MINYLRNPEIKTLILKLFIMQIIFALVIFIFVTLDISALNKKMVNQNAAMVGKIIRIHPELEEDIIPIVTKEASSEDVSVGKKLLHKYGYNEEMSVVLQPIIRSYYPGFRLRIVALFFIYLIPLLLVVLFEYKKFYAKIEKVTETSEKVISGDFDVYIKEEDTEGSLALLYHNFNIMTKRLKLSMESLKKDKEFFKNIISDISHQLKTPLSSLIVYNDILMENSDIEKDKQQDFYKRSKSQLSRMQWLTISLLKMARLEAGSIRFSKDRVMAIDVVKKAVEPIREIYEKKNQQVIIDDNFSEESFYYGDEEWTVEALINIIKNCSEHSKQKGTIKIGIESSPLFCRINVEDNGEGIDKKDLPKIFNRFYKGSNSTKTESVGIGLYLSKLIIESQGGSITVESKKAQGTKFTITFLKTVV